MVHRRRLPWLARASAVALCAASCAADTNDVGTEADLTSSGVGVVAGGCGLAQRVGSGVVVDRGDGEPVVVTVAHTIKGATEVIVVDADGGEHVARVVAFDKDADLAALEVSELAAPALDAATGSAAAAVGVDGSILTWGRDAGVEQVPIDVVKRLRVTIEDIYIDDVVERTALEIAGPVTVGDSGGPVLDADGNVIGIIYANSRGRDQVGFATDQAELSELLASVSSSTVDNGTCF